MAAFSKLVFPVIILVLFQIDSAHARGGGPNVTDSPGYQRRLVESRSQIGQPQPYTAPPSTYPGKKWKKRGKTR